MSKQRSDQLREPEALSDDFREIISYRPHWLIRWGMVLIAGIMGLMVLVCWFIEYPDVVHAPLRLIAVNAPKKVLAQTEGKIEALLVNNGDGVKQGQLLAFMQSTGKHEEVLKIKAWTSQIEQDLQKGNFDSLLVHPLPIFTNLGELQPFFVAFQPLYLETMELMNQGYYPQKMASLQRDLLQLKKEASILQKQKGLVEEDYSLQKKEYKTREKLVEQKVMAPMELLQDKSKLLAKENALHQASAALLNRQSLAFQKEQEILDLSKKMSEQKSRFSTALYQFKNHTDEWLNHYVLRAPVAGNVQFISALQTSQYISKGQELFFIAPENRSFYGEILADQSGIGKIAERQRVIIRLAGYPSAEFGYLSGQVEYISPFPLRDSSFVIKVKLPGGMKTNYGKVLAYKNNLQAEAEIITEERRLLERFTSQLGELWNRK